MILEKIISGGQTGADRAALDFALEHKIPHGGWCPLGRLAEDGPIPDEYRLKETQSGNYSLRTEWNVRDSDGTVIFSRAAVLTGGSGLTAKFCKQWKRPFIHVSEAKTKNPARALVEFIDDNRIQNLNVAGPRDSTEFGIGEFVRTVLEEALEQIR